MSVLREVIYRSPLLSDRSPSLSLRLKRRARKAWRHREDIALRLLGWGSYVAAGLVIVVVLLLGFE